MSQFLFPSQLDNTALSSFKNCPQHWYYSNIRQLEPQGANIHLHTGQAFAAGLEATRIAYFTSGASEVEAIARGLHTLILSYGDFEAPEGHVKSFDRLFFALIEYFTVFPLPEEHFTPLLLSPERHAIEVTFAIPLPIPHPQTGEPILYTGRFDAIGNYNNSFFGLDDKTATQLGTQWSKNWILDSQFTGYSWAARELGFPLAGFIVRGLSFLKNSFGSAQTIVYRPEWQIERWLSSTLHTINLMIAYHQENFYPLALDKHSCNAYGGCAFSLLCESPTPEAWIPIHYQKRTWDPLAKSEPKR